MVIMIKALRQTIGDQMSIWLNIPPITHIHWNDCPHSLTCISRLLVNDKQYKTKQGNFEGGNFMLSL